jgi:hypothetical protein
LPFHRRSYPWSSGEEPPDPDPMPVVPDEFVVPNALVPGTVVPAGEGVESRVLAPAPMLVVPDEFAVPKVFVPKDVGTFAEFPAPLGSFPELVRPPTFAGPLGTPLTPAVRTPAEPAFGDPAALPVPAVGPLAEPPAAPPPADPPPALPPPPPPPPAD